MSGGGLLSVVTFAGGRGQPRTLQAAKLRNSARVKSGAVTGSIAGGAVGALVGKGLLGGIIGMAWWR